MLIIIAADNPAYSRIEYADETGRECSYCHVSENGGPRLTREGENYKKKIIEEGKYKEPSRLSRVVLLIAGFLHMITAVMWFGTILYIHIILKPKYAAGGIPRGELKIGWVSMLIMLGTGIILTAHRFPTLRSLTGSSSGILLLVKIGLFLFMVATIFIVTFYIAQRINSSVATKVYRSYRDLSADELQAHNGKEGNPAFIAYDGIIYDVSESRRWPEGRHMGRHPSGTDLTDMLDNAPHGDDLVKIMPVVGRLIAGKSGGKEFPVKLFYFLAYSILAVIFMIIFIVSVLNWW